MNKKANSIIFMAVATLVNLVLMFVLIVLGIVLVSLIPFGDNTSLYSVCIFVVFFGAIFLAFKIYSKLVEWATEKFSLEQRLDPLFTPKRNRRDKRD